MQPRSTLLVFILFAVMGLLLSVFLFTAPSSSASPASWWQFAGDGIAGGYEAMQIIPSAMVVFGGNLYVATGGGVNGCEVWRYNGSSWTQVVGQSPLGTSGTGPGFGSSNNTDASSMAIFGGSLYVGTENTTSGCEIWRSSDGTSWAPIVGPSAPIASGFDGTANNTAASSMFVFSPDLYVGTRNALGLEIWTSSDGTGWSRVVGPGGLHARGFGDASNIEASSMSVFFFFVSQLYVGTDKGHGGGGCEVWRSPNGINWTPVVGPAPALIGDGFGDANNIAASSMAVYGAMPQLYIGTDRNWSLGGCQVWSSVDGNNWGVVPGAVNGITNPSNYTASSMVVYGGSLYVGTTGLTGWSEVIRYNGAGWARVDNNTLSQSVLGAGVTSMADYGGNLYAGISRGQWGCTVWRTAGAGGPPYTDWAKVNVDGFAPNGNEEVTCMATLGGNLYVGTKSYSGCELWRYDGSAWTALSEDGFGDTFNVRVSSMAAFKGDMYIGTQRDFGGTSGQIWRASGTTCTRVDGGALGVNNHAISSMAVFGENLYVGTSNSMGGCEMWRTSDGTTWTSVVGPAPASIGSGFGNLNWRVSSMAVFGSCLYAGTYNFNMGGCEVWRSSDGTTWTPVVGPAPAGIGNGFGNANNLVVSSMAVFSGRLYVGTDQSWGGGTCEVWSTADGTSWTRVDGGALGSDNKAASSMAAHDSRLWVGTQNVAAGCQVWSTAAVGGPPYTDWTLENTGGFGDADNTSASCIAVYFSGLNVGTRNEIDGSEIWSTGTAWYLAEGATAGGFETWVLVQNPGASPVHVNFTLNTESGEQKPPGLQNFTIPAGSRVSFDIGKEVTTYDVSTRVEATDGNVICERAMYFTPAGMSQRVLGHDSIGVTSPASVWYLAEGATAGGFETWVLVQNPGTSPVHVNFTLNTESGEQKPPGLQNFSIPAGSRVSFDIGKEVTTYDVSTKVEATDGNVICERAMYFTPPGAGQKELGHDSIGFVP